MVTFNSTFQTLLAGFKVKPTDPLEIGIDLAWNTAEAAMDPFRFLEGELFAAEKPFQSYDFSQTYSHSDLDTTFLEAALEGSYRFNDRMYLSLGYRYLDYQDDAPYLYDTSGSVQFYRLGLGWYF